MFFRFNELRTTRVAWGLLASAMYGGIIPASAVINGIIDATPEKMYQRGVMYAKGWGLAKDEARAFSWIRQAAQHRHIVAQCHLGEIYMLGLGVPKDEEQGLLWYERAAKQRIHKKSKKKSSLKFSGLKTLTNAFFLKANLRHLRHLDIVCCPQITEDAIYCLSKSDITFLRIEGAPQIRSLGQWDPENFEATLQIEHLRKLVLHNLERLERIYVESFSLNELHITSCPNLKELGGYSDILETVIISKDCPLPFKELIAIVRDLEDYQEIVILWTSLPQEQYDALLRLCQKDTFLTELNLSKTMDKQEESVISEMIKSSTSITKLSLSQDCFIGTTNLFPVLFCHKTIESLTLQCHRRSTWLLEHLGKILRDNTCLKKLMCCARIVCRENGVE